MIDFVPVFGFFAAVYAALAALVVGYQIIEGL